MHMNTTMFQKEITNTPESKQCMILFHLNVQAFLGSQNVPPNLLLQISLILVCLSCMLVRSNLFFKCAIHFKPHPFSMFATMGDRSSTMMSLFPTESPKKCMLYPKILIHNCFQNFRPLSIFVLKLPLPSN